MNEEEKGSLLEKATEKVAKSKSEKGQKKGKVLLVLALVAVFALGVGVGEYNLWSNFYNFYLIRIVQHDLAIVIEGVNLRSEPDIESSVLMVVKEGTKVQVLDDTKAWHKIEVTDETGKKIQGYLISDYLK